MKCLIISTIFSLYLASCLAATNTVKFRYNDGFSDHEIDIPLDADEIMLDRIVQTGSQLIPRTNVHAAQIVGVPLYNDVFCVYFAEEEELLTPVGIADGVTNTATRYLEPPQAVTLVTCYVYDPHGMNENERFELQKSIVPEDILERLWNTRYSTDLPAESNDVPSSNDTGTPSQEGSEIDDADDPLK